MRARGIGFVAVAAALVACSDSSHPPSLSSFVLNSARLPQDQFLGGSMVFEDPDGDLASVEWALTDRRSGLTSRDQEAIPDARGVRTSTLFFTIDVSTLSPSAYELEVALIDATGARSAPLSAEFDLYGGFRNPSAYPLPRTFVFLGNTAVGDLDGDGRNDVVAMEYSNAANRVYLYHQTAQGTLALPPEEIATGLSQRGIAVGDVNGDGLADLVVCGEPQSGGATTAVLAYLQDPATGRLHPPLSVPLGSAGGVAIADVDGDGRKDVVVGGWGAVEVLFQDVSGVLGAPVELAPGLYSIGGEVHLGDMDGNGLLDVVVRTGGRQMAVLRQLSPRTFAPSADPYDALTSYWPEVQAFALGDVNGDGRTDMVVTDPGNGGYLNFFLQTDHGTLAGPIARSPGFDMPAGVEIADVDGDGLADLLFDSGGSSITVAHQGQDHAFADVYWYSIPTWSSGGTSVAQALSVADVTGDGRPDLVVSWMDEGVFVIPHL